MIARIKTLIVDDEPAARERITTLLQADPTIQVVGECGDGIDAVSAIKQLEPDLLFLDIQLPRLDGFKVLKKTPPEKLPIVVFVTAYDKYALNAFDTHALDYLLKPFNRDRFHRALERAKVPLHNAGARKVDARVLAALQEINSQRAYLERLVIKSAGYVFFLKVEEIDWIEAADNYVRLHVRKDGHLFRETMNAIEAKLDPKKFLRIQRSIIVNLDRIRRMHPLFRGEYEVELIDGTRLTSSRHYRDKLSELLGKTP